MTSPTLRFPFSFALFACLSTAAATAQSSTGYVNFESPQSRSIAISADGKRLFAINTPAHLLSVFSLEHVSGPTGPVLIREIPVGVEPVSIAIRTLDEVWVLNYVSDSVSVVSISKGAVIDTIPVGDEPGDVVFAGNPQRAFITSTTERKVHVFDPSTRKRVGTIDVFGDDPRSLLASPDGKTVWVAITRSGNKTTIVPHTIAPLPPKPTNTSLPLAPKQGIIVSSEDKTWKPKINVTLPDHDVVEIDVATLKVRRNYSGAGTIMFNLALRPGTNELWVANTSARNLVRFETALRGHTNDSHVTRIVTGSKPTVTPVNLNPGFDYSKLPNASALTNALAQPTDVAFDSAGKVAYVTAFGTDRIGVLDTTGKVTARIEVGNTAGTKVAPRTKRGPRALAHHPSSGVLYVLNRLSNSVSVIDTAKKTVLREIPMQDPTPKHIKEGRGFLFDAKLSGAGTTSCASCHIDARTDGLAWDLGNPGGTMFNNGTPTKLHPMKGPLLTQTLQGFLGERVFHWRADRPGLVSFNGTFDDLMGASKLSDPDMKTFVDYMQDIRFGPNPNRNRNDTLPTKPVGTSPKDGEVIFTTKANVGKDGSTQFKCVGCHTSVSGSGSFGFNGLIGQSTKAAQLRGLYKRTGRKVTTAGRTAGFGFGADGSKDDLPTFLSTTSRFNPLTAKEKAALQAFLFAFPTGTAPAVGFARTVTSANFNATDVQTDITLLTSQADAGKCDLIAKGFLDGRQVGFSYNKTTKKFDRDRKSLAAMTATDLGKALSAQKGSVLTLQGVPGGSGRRLGIDRDADGVLDGDMFGVPYGNASPAACANLIRLEINAAPRIGNSRFAITASGAPSAATGWLLLSTTKANLKVVDLDLLVDLNVGALVAVQADSRGEVVVPIGIPNNTAIIGFRGYVQSAMSAPCGLLRASASKGLEVTLLR